MLRILLILLPFYAIAQVNSSEYPEYRGKDLGLTISGNSAQFKVWAPTATQVMLRIYTNGTGGTAIDSFLLHQAEQGTWVLKTDTKYKHHYYTFQCSTKQKRLAESPDIYAKAVGMNGKRAFFLDLHSTNPEGWEKDKKPALASATSIIIYETHLRDLSIAPNSGINNKGKYLALTELNTHLPEGPATGLDHLKELGITHLHILPTYDFNSIDESKNEAAFNWGYDPVNYNAPEGSYSTNSGDAALRIKEFKAMVQQLHANGIRVVLDMVYNHTANLEAPFNQFVPSYYYRLRNDGSYSDASGCGNETASEKAMMRKFMIESTAYWVNEFHVDGFRFDLMGVHDIATMNAISDSLHQLDASLLLYGEGWTAGSSTMPEDLRAVKKNTAQLNQIAAFADEMRDALHGPYNRVKEAGFASGKNGTEESVKFGIVGATQHPEINYALVNYSSKPWANSPMQSINYVSCHDDNTLFDRLKISNPAATEEELIKMDKLCQGTVLTSQGIPFIHSGAEFLRSKKGIANSYNSPDSINQLDWSLKLKHASVFTYYKKLIAMRLHHPAFRMESTEQIQKNLHFLPVKDSLFIAYRLNGKDCGDSWKNIVVCLNGNPKEITFTLPKGVWIQVVDGFQVKEKGLSRASSNVKIPGTSMAVFIQADGQ